MECDKIDPNVIIPPKLSYSGVPVSRAEDKRRDIKWLNERKASGDSGVVPIWRDRNLINSSEPNPSVYIGDVASRLLREGDEIVFLGIQDETAIFGVDISSFEESAAVALVGAGSFLDLRYVGPTINAKEAALMSYARAMVYWHRNNGFCSRCGHVTESQQGGHRRKCMDSKCSTINFPRMDPAVIMLVEYRPNDGQSPMCLLANHYRFPGNIYSTLAGFVEPGESLEDTVAREVYEEVGLRVNSIGYQASQPWPFPSSIMLGYRARAEMTEIKIDREEIKDAKWFTVEEIRDFGEWGDKSVPRALPRKDSIARFLIDLWVSELIK